MLFAFLVLTGLSLVAMLVGAALLLGMRGRWERRSGPEVGAEAAGVGKGFFRGSGLGLHGEVSYSPAQVRDLVVTRKWGELTTVAVAMAGFVGVLIFGSLCLYLLIEERVIGALLVAVVLYALVRQAIWFVQGYRQAGVPKGK
jgi:hypothetical protein